MKKYLAALLMGAMVFALTACGSKAPDLTGDWKCSVDLNDYVKDSADIKELYEELATEFGDDITEVLTLDDLTFAPMEAVMTLNADKTYTLKIDEEWTKGMAEELGAWMADKMEPMIVLVLEKELADMDMTIEDMCEIYEVESVAELLDMMGMDKETMTAEFTSDAGGIDLDMSMADEEGTWEYKDGKVVTTGTLAGSGEETNDEYKYDKTADTLSFEDEDLGEIVLTRVK